MLNRRLWMLFIAFVLGFAALGARLAKLQLADSGEWRAQLQKFLHREYPIETYRGSILDRNGLPLARDVPSDELAIDYRAMNMDDAWLTKRAIEQLRDTGEWGHFKDKQERNRRLEEIKNQLAAKIDSIPDAVAAALAQAQSADSPDHPSIDDLRNEILQRYSDIRLRIHAIQEDVYSRRFIRSAAESRMIGAVASSGDSSAESDDSALDALYRQVQLKDQTAAHTLYANIPASVALYFKQHLAEFPGLLVRDNAEHNRREYPFGESTSQLVGVLNSVSPEKYRSQKFDLPNLLVLNDPADLKGYLPGDRMGEMGIEAISEEQLRGSRGVGLVDLADPSSPSDDAGADGAETRRIAPIPGKDVQLTLDAALQRDLYNALKDPARRLLIGEDEKQHFVALVILKLDGQLLAAVSYPSFDPSTLDSTRSALMKDAYRFPMLNRAISGTYTPGSTVKPLLASAALSERLITPEETILCTGHFYPTRDDILRCDARSGHGPMALVEAIAKSCNVYFYTVGQRLGIERLSAWYGNYGFGHDSGMELPEPKGSIPPAAMATLDPERAKRDALYLGIGQGPIDCTPLQMANAYATLLRGGVVIAPRILAATPVQQSQAFILSPQILAIVRSGMEHVTSEGTGHEIFGKGKFNLRVAGKTGTAEKDRAVFDDNGQPVDDLSKPLLRTDGTPILKADGAPMYKQLVNRNDDAWFVGYAPADNPQYVVAAVMEWGGHGGAHAAPMVKEAFRQLQMHDYLPHTDVP